MRHRAFGVIAWTIAGLGAPQSVHAEDEDLRLLREPTLYTDVIDAFDDGDPFDLNLSLGFARSVTRSRIEREVSESASVDGTSDTRLLHVADGKRTVNQLLLGLQVGLFRDLALLLEVPLVLSDSNVLSMPEGINGSEQAAIEDALAAPAPGAADPAADSQALFDLSSPQTSATRSGVPAIHLGLAWGVTNQYRSPELPTWVLALQTRIGTGDVLEPCLEGGACDPGVSRGTIALRAESRWSYRLGSLEPFLGLAYEGEWATAAAELFEPGGDLEGQVDTRPPTHLELTLGLSVIPWEDRMRFQRFSIDVTGRAEYVSSGRDYSPLFDVLGTSPSPYLTADNYDRLVSDPGDRTAVPFTGVTNTAAHGQFALNTRVVMQAARYVRFGLGFGVAYTTPHLLTGADACNAEVSASASDPRVGNCTAGILNPIHRPVIDLPGNRFRLGGALSTDLVATATGQF